MHNQLIADATFDRGGLPDSTLDGRVEPILPGPEGNPQFDRQLQQLQATWDERFKTQETEFEQRIEQVGASARHNQTLHCLQHQVDTAHGDDLQTVKYRSALQDLILQVHRDSNADHVEILTQATTLAHAHSEAIIASGGDSTGEMVPLRDTRGPHHPYFDMRNFMTTLAKDCEAQGNNFSLETLGQKEKCEEIEYITTLSGPHQSFVDKMIGEVEAEVRSHGAKNPAVIPFPVNAIDRSIEMDAAFAETYAESVVPNAQRREPTFRGDLLVPYFRPTNVLASLGVPNIVISNDQTLPRLTSSLEADWLAETATIADGNLTFVSATSSPKRLGVRDDVTWMNLVAANSQMPIMPIVTSEFAAALAQAEEKGVYSGSGTSGQPTGILSTTGINAEPIASNSPTLSDMLNISHTLQAADIPDEMAKYVITPGQRKHLFQILRYPATVGGNNRALYEGERYTGQAGQGIRGPMGYIVEVPAWITNNLPRNLGGANNEHQLLFGVWQYVVVFQYSMAFLTIDDISQAASATTRITVNKFCDVFVRLPAAFCEAQWLPA